MAWNKIFLLKTGEMDYYSIKFDLHFVSKSIEMTGNGGTLHTRTRYFTFGRGRNRAKHQGIIRLSYEEYKKKMNYCKMMEELDKQTQLKICNVCIQTTKHVKDICQDCIKNEMDKNS